MPDDRSRICKLEAIIRMEKLDDVKNSLERAGFSGMTVSEVRGRGRQKGYLLNFRGKDVRIDLLPKVKLEIVMDERELDKAIKLVRESAFTGEVGDGKIFVYPVEEVVRIRTEERGINAI